MGLHKSEANLEVAKRENEVILLEKDYTRQYDGFDPNSPEANIIFSLYQNIFLEQSLRMATYIQNEVKEKGRSPRGVKQAGFLVLYKTTMPSVLVETGFLSNSAEEKYLSSQKGQNEIALAVFNAFKSYKNSVETQKNENEKTDTQEVKKVVEPVKVDTAKKGEKESPAKEESGPAVKKEEKKEPKEKEVVKEKEAPANENDKVKNDKVYWGVQFYSSSRSLPAGHKIRNAFDQVREDLENGIYKYSTGMLEDKNVAIKLQENVREKGYKDAFLIAFLNDKKITVNQAYDYLRKK
jgi:N-acetylmuramoyl-L-alanine amidase